MPFQRLLQGLVDGAQGARGAVFCDYEGEFVHLVIRDRSLSDYDMRCYGAHLAAAWTNLRANSNAHGAGGIAEMKVDCAGGALLCRALPDGYYLVLLLEQGAPTAKAAFQMRRVALEVAREL